MQRNWDLIKQVILIIEKSDKNEPLRKTAAGYVVKDISYQYNGR